MINSDVVKYSKSLENLHIARWHELPDFDLYATQIIEIVKKELFFLSIFDEEFLTKSMLNNYVKNKVIPKPENKKYTREALAKLIVITLLKQIMEISDVKDGMRLQIQNSGGVEKAYNLFCGQIEEAVRLIFVNNLKTDKTFDLTIKNIDKINIVTNLAALALVSKLMIKKVVSSKGFIIKNDDYE